MTEKNNSPKGAPDSGYGINSPEGAPDSGYGINSPEGVPNSEYRNNLIDIILPVSGNYNLTKTCIDSIFRNTNNPFKLIIVDNGIAEPELIDYLSVLSKEHDNVRLIAKGTTRGYAVSLNKGLEVSTSELIAVLNNGVKVSKNWL